jgi:hypothetical protein
VHTLRKDSQAIERQVLNGSLRDDKKEEDLRGHGGKRYGDCEKWERPGKKLES